MIYIRTAFLLIEIVLIVKACYWFDKLEKLRQEQEKKGN